MKCKRNLETGIHDLLFLLFFFALYPHRERKRRKRKKKREKRTPQGGICHVALLPCGLQRRTFTTSLTVVNNVLFFGSLSFFFLTRTWPEIEKKGIFLIQNQKRMHNSIPKPV